LLLLKLEICHSKTSRKLRVTGSNYIRDETIESIHLPMTQGTVWAYKWDTRRPRIKEDGELKQAERGNLTNKVQPYDKLVVEMSVLGTGHLAGEE